MAAEEILFELETTPSETVITTEQQLQKALGPDGEATVGDLLSPDYSHAQRAALRIGRHDMLQDLAENSVLPSLPYTRMPKATHLPVKNEH